MRQGQKKGPALLFCSLFKVLFLDAKSLTAKVYIAWHSSAGSGAGRRPAATGCAPAPHNEEPCTVGMWITPVNRWETCFSIREPISVFQHFHSVPIRPERSKPKCHGCKRPPTQVNVSTFSGITPPAMAARINAPGAATTEKPARPRRQSTIARRAYSRR